MKMLRWGSFAIFSLFLTACQLKNSQFDLPDEVTFQHQRFEKVTHNQIDDMQQLLYLPAGSDKNPDNWQKGILLFVDKNSKDITLFERATLRTNAFAKQEDTQAKVEVIHNELQSEVLYPPTERFNDVQLEVSRGRELQCGYAQMQFSDKRSAFANKKQNLTAYQQALSQLAIEFSQLAWQIDCK